MAQLSITVGSVTGSITANNAKAKNVLEDVINLFELTGTDQEKLDQIAQLTANWLVEKSQQFRKRDALRSAEQNVEDNIDHQWK